MPLPKVDNIEARATELYANLIQHVLKLQSAAASRNAADPSDDVHRSVLRSHLPYLRQLLTCCACGGLLDRAMVSPGCQHHYCSHCPRRAPLWRITCRQCRERADLARAEKMQSLADCYRAMCRLIRTFYSSSSSSNAGTELREHCSEAVAEEEKEEDFDLISDLLLEVESGRRCSLQIFKLKPPKELLVSEMLSLLLTTPTSSLSSEEPVGGGGGGGGGGRGLLQKVVVKETLSSYRDAADQRDSPVCSGGN